MSGRFAATILAFALAVFGPGSAPAFAQEIWSVGPGSLSLNVTEAKFIKLETPAKAVFLSNPSVAEIDFQSARYIYIVGRAIGETNLFVLGEDDEEVISTTIKVGIDAGRLAAAAQRAISGGHVSVQAVEGAIFLTGTVRTADDAQTAEDVVAGLAGGAALIVNRLELETLAQVNLQVRIAEVSRTISEDLGIRLSAGNGSGTRTFEAAPTGIDGGFTLSIGSGTRNINLVLDALARNGQVSILSEPNLTARSGETATFLAGGRIPYKTRSDQGENVTMESVGVELEFTPHVFADNLIQLQLRTQVRDVDTTRTSDAATPALTERSATTTIELGSGQSFAIAGMFQTNANQQLTGIPGLINLPIIGALFRSSKYARGETELVIIVTPYLVTPVSPRELRTPVDALRPPSGGIEQAITGQMNRTIRPGTPGKSRVRSGGFLLQ